MSEPCTSWKLVSDDRAVRADGDGTRTQSSRRQGESVDAFAERVRWGRMDDLAIAYASDQDGKILASTLGQYRSEISKILMPIFGEHWLVDCDGDVYDLLVGIADTRSFGHYDRGHRTLGAVISWAMRKKRWPKAVPPFGGLDYRRAVHKNKMRDAPAKTEGSRGGLITLEDCPTYDDIRAFGDDVGEAAAATWGEPARALGELPVAQYATGARIATAFAMNASGLLVGRKKFHFTSQVRRKSWDPAPAIDPGADWTPPLGLVKTGQPKGFYAEVWDWTMPGLAELCDEASSQRSGWLFATLLPRYKRPLDRFESLLREVAADTGYSWTSHWHRHSYASENLAPKDDGGYGRSDMEVANWLGDTVQSVRDVYWHASADTPGNWSSSRPTRRR